MREWRNMAAKLRGKEHKTLTIVGESRVAVTTQEPTITTLESTNQNLSYVIVADFLLKICRGAI